MTLPRVCFFDAGGTLLHTAQPVGEIYAEVARSFGQSFDPIRLQQVFQAGIRRFRSRPAGKVPSDGDDRVRWRFLVKGCLGGEEICEPFDFEAYFDVLYRTFADSSVWSLYPEVREVLSELRRWGCRMAILSNWDERLNPVLDGLGIGGFFEKRFISAERGHEKPDPEIYCLALREMGMEAEDAVMVGDDPVNDDEVPGLLGMRTVLIRRPERDLRTVLEIVSDGKVCGGMNQRL